MFILNISMVNIGIVVLPFALIQSIDPGLAGLSAAKRRLKDLEQISGLLKAGDDALASGLVLEPVNSSALYYYKQVLKNAPQSAMARKGLENIQLALVERALESARELDFETAETWLQEASVVWEDQTAVERVRIEIADIKRDRAADLE